MKIVDITKQNESQVPAKRGGYKIEFIVVHYLGVSNVDNPNLYGGGYGGHFNITRDGTIYQAAIPENDVVWQCGGGRQGYDPGSGTYFGICGNYNSIGIENSVCMSDGVWYFTKETQESLVELVKYLMKKYNIPEEHVIRHWDVTGKHCPAPYVENNKYKTNWTWDEFKTRIRSGGKDEDMSVVDAYAKNKVKTIYAKRKHRKVVIDPGDLLNVRTGPDASCPNNPAWPKLANDNDVDEILRLGSWSLVSICPPGIEGTIGYVKTKYLK